MVKSENKKFLYPKGTRLWALYLRSGHRTYGSLRSNAQIVKGWRPCRNGCEGPCRAGAMEAILGGGGSSCVSSPKEGGYKYVTPVELEELIAKNEVRNYRIEGWRRRSGPRVWTNYKEEDR